MEVEAGMLLYFITETIAITTVVKIFKSWIEKKYLAKFKICM